ncbi:hypothetical protein GCM10009805_21090 [Leucobacter chromiireducens subsp. solipictus]
MNGAAVEVCLPLDCCLVKARLELGSLRCCRHRIVRSGAEQHARRAPALGVPQRGLPPWREEVEPGVDGNHTAKLPSHSKMFEH